MKLSFIAFAMVIYIHIFRTNHEWWQTQYLIICLVSICCKLAGLRLIESLKIECEIDDFQLKWDDKILDTMLSVTFLFFAWVNRKQFDSISRYMFVWSVEAATTNMAATTSVSDVKLKISRFPLLWCIWFSNLCCDISICVSVGFFSFSPQLIQYLHMYCLVSSNVARRQRQRGILNM